MRNTWRAGTVALLLVFGSTVRAEPPAAPEFPSSISIVVLPVFVTDRDGHAVQGLTRDDFEIRDDG